MRTKQTHGTVKWMADADNGNKVIRVTTDRVSHEYEIDPQPEGGYNLLSLRKEKGELVIRCYKVRCNNRGQQTCDCPDALRNRHQQCKHVRGLQAAFNALPF